MTVPREPSQAIGFARLVCLFDINAGPASRILLIHLETEHLDLIFLHSSRICYANQNH